MNQKYVLSVLTLALAGTVSMDVQAETVPGTNLSVNFQSAHIVGAGRNINVLRVPVTDLTTGQTTLISTPHSVLPSGQMKAFCSRQ